MKINEIKEIVEMINSSNITSFRYSDGETNIEIGVGVSFSPVANNNISNAPVGITATPSNNVVSEVPVTTSSPASNLTDVIAPLVGVFYSKPSPTSDAFVKVGDSVKKGQTLCIVEAMKVMNEVPAAFDMKIVEICAEDSDVVEYGQAIFKVEKL